MIEERTDEEDLMASDTAATTAVSTSDYRLEGESIIEQGLGPHVIVFRSWCTYGNGTAMVSIVKTSVVVLLKKNQK